MFSEMDPAQFPALYRAHHNHHLEDLPFWLTLAESRLRLPNHSILELGCGTGRILLPMVKAGYPVFGLDYDREMLGFLSAQIESKDRAAIHLIQADMTQFHFAAQFGLIILPCNTLSILSASEMSKLLECASCHLEPGGIFSASLPNPHLLLHLPKFSEAELEETFPHPVDGQTVQVWSAWQRNDQIFNVTWSYDHLLQDGRVERLQTTVEHHIEPVQFYRQVLEDAGFSSIQLCGHYDRRPYRRTSPSLILIASMPIE